MSESSVMMSDKTIIIMGSKKPRAGEEREEWLAPLIASLHVVWGRLDKKPACRRSVSLSVPFGPFQH